MTNRTLILTSVLAGVLVIGCGGSGGGGNSANSLLPQDFTSNMPVTVPSANLTDIEVTGPVTSNAGSEAALAEVMAPISDPCHPALFQRTYEISDILNIHTHRMMDRIRDIIAHPRRLDGSLACKVDDPTAPTQISCTLDPRFGLYDGYPLTLTWQKSAITGGDQYVTNVYIQSSSTTAADLYQCELGSTVTPAPTFGPCTTMGSCPTCTTIFSSTLDATTSTTGFDVSNPSANPMLFDFTSLHNVDSNELATGTFQVNVDLTKDSTKPNPFRRVLGFKFSNFVPAPTAAEMAIDGPNHGSRNGTFAHIGYTGSQGGGGGAMAYADDVILFCPPYTGEANPPTLYSDALTLGRWYLSTTNNATTLASRVDAEAVGDSGGASPTGNGGGNAQLPLGDTYEGGVCHSATIGGLLDPIVDVDNDPWMFVEVGANNAVVPGTYKCGPGTPCVTACDSAFGSLPSVSNNQLENALFPFGSFMPSVNNSGIPIDPADIETALAPLLCGTKVGTAWTGQPNCD